jgi:hypothetical protein
MYTYTQVQDYGMGEDNENASENALTFVERCEKELIADGKHTVVRLPQFLFLSLGGQDQGTPYKMTVGETSFHGCRYDPMAVVYLQDAHYTLQVKTTHPAWYVYDDLTKRLTRNIHGFFNYLYKPEAKRLIVYQKKEFDVKMEKHIE